MKFLSTIIGSSSSSKSHHKSKHATSKPHKSSRPKQEPVEKYYHGTSQSSAATINRVGFNTEYSQSNGLTDVAGGSYSAKLYASGSDYTHFTKDKSVAKRIAHQVASARNEYPATLKVELTSSQARALAFRRDLEMPESTDSYKTSSDISARHVKPASRGGSPVRESFRGFYTNNSYVDSPYDSE